MEKIVGDQECERRNGGWMNHHHRMSVQFMVPFDRLDEFVEAVKPFSRMIYNHGFKYHRSVSFKNSMRRINFISEVMKDFGIFKIGGLFRVLARNGYGNSYKTLQRDLCAMAVMGMIETWMTRGGKHGNTTFIRLKTEAQDQGGRTLGRK